MAANTRNDISLLVMMAHTTGWPIYFVWEGSKMYYDENGERVAPKPRGNCIIIQLDWEMERLPKTYSSGLRTDLEDF